MRARTIKTIKTSAVLILTGCAYLLFYLKTGIGIPCFFNLITGLQCPGCGTTRMIKSIALLDFRAAFGYNPVVFVMLPLILFFIGRYLYQWIRYGKSNFTKAETVIQIIMITILIIFGIVRNII